MTTQNKNHSITGDGFRNLLFLLLLYVLGSPFLEPYPFLAVLAHISLSMALFGAVYAINKHKNQRSFAGFLLIPLLTLYWLSFFDVIDFSRIGAHLLFTIFYALLIYTFTLQIKNSRRVTLKELYAIFSLYLIIGLFWGSLYTLLHHINPGAYSGALLESTNNASHLFNYFSFVTLTTLGYGDITPQTAGAGALCQMEAIVGQFFTAVVVAWLVGMFISSKQETDTN
jgi:voltage-gated potassium channel